MDPCPLVRALSQSLNLATVNLGLAVGLPQVAAEFKKLGLENEPARNPALLLGGIDLSPLEVSQLYNTVANGGFRHAAAGRARGDRRTGQAVEVLSAEVTQVVDADAVYQLDRMMIQVIERGTGRGGHGSIFPPTSWWRARPAPPPITPGQLVRRFSGQHLAVVWVGYDDISRRGLTGAGGALAVWFEADGRHRHELVGRGIAGFPAGDLDRIWNGIAGTARLRRRACPGCRAKKRHVAGQNRDAKRECSGRGVQGVGNWLKSIIH